MWAGLCAVEVMRPHFPNQVVRRLWFVSFLLALITPSEGGWLPWCETALDRQESLATLWGQAVNGEGHMVRKRRLPATNHMSELGKGSWVSWALRWLPPWPKAWLTILALQGLSYMSLWFFLAGEGGSLFSFHTGSIVPKGWISG